MRMARITSMVEALGYISLGSATSSDIPIGVNLTIRVQPALAFDRPCCAATRRTRSAP
jgi:hypothetical protein